MCGPSTGSFLPIFAPGLNVEKSEKKEDCCSFWPWDSVDLLRLSFGENREENHPRGGPEETRVLLLFERGLGWHMSLRIYARTGGTLLLCSLRGRALWIVWRGERD